MNVDKWLSKIGIGERLAPTVETLCRLHVAHLETFQFHNLEIQQDSVPSLDPAAIERKFETMRGGYCFEHNTLFAAGLRELGFEVAPLLARTGPPGHRSLTHMLLRVHAGDRDWIADTGFGGTTLLEPIPLEHGLRVEQRGLTYSLHRDAYFWTLTLNATGIAEDLYEFSEAPVTADDLEIANWYTATHPQSIFRRTLTIQRVTRDERLILRPRVITRIVNGVREDTAIEPAMLRRHAQDLFGVTLPDDPMPFERP